MKTIAEPEALPADHRLHLLAAGAIIRLERRRALHVLEPDRGRPGEVGRAGEEPGDPTGYGVLDLVGGLPGGEALLVWWLVTVAQGDPNEVLTWCCAIFGASFILAVVVLARRG